MQEPVKAEKMISTLPFRAGVIILLCFYLAAFVYSPIGVPHIHHDDDIHTGDACQKDACHISIYHPGAEGACSHKFHFTQSKKECDFCNVVMPRQLNTPEVDFTTITQTFSYTFINPEVENAKCIVVSQKDRGPPFLI